MMDAKLKKVMPKRLQNYVRKLKDKGVLAELPDVVQPPRARPAA